MEIKTTQEISKIKMMKPTSKGLVFDYEASNKKWVSEESIKEQHSIVVNGELCYIIPHKELMDNN